MQLWLPSSRLSLQPIFNTLSRKFISRAFSTTPRPYAISFRDLKSDEKGKAPPRPEADKASKKDTSSAEEEDPAEKAYREAQRESQANFKRQKEEQKKEESSAGGKEGADGEGEQQKRRKDEPPPPPPHGNKSPWQVFTDTLKTEFKASKEWNESTKQLASSAHQFTENESVKRARAAYTAASGAATSGTATALKGAGKAVGQGAAWTWDSTPVKVVRSGVSATGRGIEAATRPVRETKVYKTAVGGVKNVIDDGSSSKYGGWVEKEERRRQRELREMNEAAASGIPGRRMEKMEEDPKYILRTRKTFCPLANLSQRRYECHTP
jgi:import inner membrane translocase subunit TIM44